MNSLEKAHQQLRLAKATRHTQARLNDLEKTVQYLISYLEEDLEKTSLEDTETLEDLKEQSSSTSQKWLSPVNPDGRLSRSALEDIWGYLSSLRIVGNVPESYQVEVILTPTGSKPTNRDTEQPSGTELPSEKAASLSRSGAHGTAAQE